MARSPSTPRLRRTLRDRAPDRRFERELWRSGCDVVVGVDEAGRGAWAGPLTVGAVVIPRDRRIVGVRDSKLLTEPEREAMFDRIRGWAEAWGVGHVSPRECDDLGMSEAQRLAARRALADLGDEVHHVLVDGTWSFVDGPATAIEKGDLRCLSIAAASIIAKVSRDRIMRAADLEHPAYDLAWNKGYPCSRHREALRGRGPSAIHRLSWSFIDDIPWTGARRRVRPDPQGRLFD